MLDQLPEISIITINYNNAAGLQKTMQSVFNQSFSDYEFIVIDGGSTDGSKEYIEHHATKLAYWVSEKDRGIYNAMNKGILKASGSYLLFLNSGDYLYDEHVLGSIVKTGMHEDIIYGDIVWESSGKLDPAIFPDVLTFEYFTGQSLPHQASFIRSGLFNLIGLYDEQYKIVADWHFFILAIYRFNCTYKHVAGLVSVCGRDGISCNPQSWNQIVSDREKVITKYFSSIYRDYKSLMTSKIELEALKNTRFYRTYLKLRKILGN